MISFRNVTKKFGDFTAVDNLSFDIESYELFVIIGPSGSGKTTTMEMINKLTDLTEGDIYIDDTNINDINKVELRRSMGYVIQDIGLMPHMNISDNISLVTRLKGDKKDTARIDELLELVNLDPDGFKTRFPDELSGGQQQRIGVVRALYSNPNIILMDEAFSSLDPVTRSELQDEFIHLQKNIKKTIVFVTHDMDEALKIADRILVMRDGHIEQLGTPHELIFNPKNDFIKSFIGRDRQRRFAIEHFDVKEWADESHPKFEVGDSEEDIICKMKTYRVTQLPREKDGAYYFYNLYNALEGNFKLERAVELNLNLDFDTAMNIMNQNKEKLHVIIDEKKEYYGVLDNNRLIEILATDREYGDIHVE